MPRTDITQLSDDARIWIFGISPALDTSAAKRLLSSVNGFLDEWTAHGQPVTAGRQLLESSFLVIGVEKTAAASGCSIDRMFGTLRELERELGVSILDAERVFIRHGDGRVDAISRNAFREAGDPHTIVFDTTAERLGDVRNGSWERRAEQSWHRTLLTGFANRRAT
jgi:hypothetical protein